MDTGDWNNYTVSVKMRLDAVSNDPEGNFVLDTVFGLILYDQRPLDLFHLVLFEYQREDILVSMTSADGGDSQVDPFKVELGVWYDLKATVETLEEFRTHHLSGGRQPAGNART